MAPFLRRAPLARRSVLLASLLFGAACAEQESFIGGGSDAGGDSSQGGSADGAGGVGTGASPGTGGGPSTGGMAQGGNPGTGGMGTGGTGTGGGANPNDYPPETEPNDTIAKANGLAAGTLGFSATASASDVDTFYFDAPLGSTVRVAISDGLGGCPADANVTVSVFTPSTVLLTSKSGLCPVLDGTTIPAFNAIPTGGLYFVQVDPTSAVGSYVIEIEVSAPVCGDNVVQLGEQCDDGNMVDGDGCESDCTNTPACGDAMVQAGEECDDGNTAAGDGCDASCQLEGNYCPEGEPNNTYQTATPITVCLGGQGMITPVGDLDFYAIDVPAGGSVRAEVVDLLGSGCPAGFDSQIRLYDSTGTELGNDDDDGTNACSLITPVDAFAHDLAAGTYYVSVEEFANNGTSPPYVLLLSSLAPSCGDSLLQMGEQCDDGNTTDGDGCSALCAIEGNFCPEMEANNTYQTANAVIAGCDGVTGGLAVGDIDFYAVTLAASGSIKVESFDATGISCTSVDTVVRLYDSSGTQLGSDDDDGINTCSLINPATDVFASNLAAGTYYVSVEEYSMNDVVPAYVVRITTP